MRSALSVFLISGTTLIAIGPAMAMGVPAVASAATAHPTVRHSVQTEAQVPPSPNGRQQAIRHRSIPGPTISGYGVEETMQILGGSGYTPGGLVFEGDWTGTAWSGHSDVHADSQGDIGRNWFTEQDCDNTVELYGYDWTTGTYTSPVNTSVNCTP